MICISNISPSLAWLSQMAALADIAGTSAAVYSIRHDLAQPEGLKSSDKRKLYIKSSWDERIIQAFADKTNAARTLWRRSG